MLLVSYTIRKATSFLSMLRRVQEEIKLIGTISLHIVQVLGHSADSWSYPGLFSIYYRQSFRVTYVLEKDSSE